MQGQWRAQAGMLRPASAADSPRPRELRSRGAAGRSPSVPAAETPAEAPRRAAALKRTRTRQRLLMEPGTSYVNTKCTYPGARAGEDEASASPGGSDRAPKIVKAIHGVVRHHPHNLMLPHKKLHGDGPLLQLSGNPTFSPSSFGDGSGSDLCAALLQQRGRAAGRAARPAAPAGGAAGLAPGHPLPALGPGARRACTVCKSFSW